MKDTSPQIAPFQRVPPHDLSGRAPVFSIMIIFLICAAGFVYYYRSSVAPAGRITAAAPAADNAHSAEKRQETRKEPAAQLHTEMPDKPEARGAKGIANDIISGWVTITDPWGRLVTKFRAGMAGQGWLALPTRACLGGKKWEFYPDAGGKSSISGGLWVYGDSVGLWRTGINAGRKKGTGLGTWDENEPVAWVSVESDRKHPPLKLPPGRPDGFFLSSSLPDLINETGVFIQNGTIVGWSFGDWLEYGYMWKGLDGKPLKERTWVSSFYNITFANGREEKFAMAMSMGKNDDGIDQLASLLDGFRFQPKLSPEDTPFYLLPEEVIRTMRHILPSAARAGHEARIVNMVSSRMLKTIGDLHLVMDVAPLIKTVLGIEAAIGEMEDSGTFIVRQLGTDAPEFHTLHAELYREWLLSLVSSESVDAGLQAFDSAKVYFPDDPLIHLFGVELEILNNNWPEAERLLFMRDYPPALQDRYRLLALRISELKGQEEQVVIRFPGRSGRIIVTAVINGTSSQAFLVDTGASMVTIPSSSAEALGFDSAEGDYGRTVSVSTAGGVVTAREVILDAIEINGWVEYDVNALVLDMPDQPGLGLLGLNYLGRFEVDLRPEEGTLLMKPR